MKNNTGDIWGGLASMLVALPQSIAFGIIVYSGLGAEYVSTGALAGSIGAIVIGIVTPLLGGTPRLISSPCAPSAAFLAGLLSESWLKNIAPGAPEKVIAIIGLTVLFAGIFQIIFSVLGGGKVIKYIPYPVVTGYLSSVGIIIFLGQFPRLTGINSDAPLKNIVLNPGSWSMPSLIVGLGTIMVMYFSPRITKKIPAPLIGLGGGIVIYFLLSIFYPALLVLDGNSLVVGRLQGDFSMKYFLNRISGFSQMEISVINECILAGATLAVVLSIDTLKTCVIVDTIGHTRSNSNRELFGQGVGNLAAAGIGGIAGAGTLGATLVNLSSGAQTRLSGAFSGLFSLLTFVVLSPLIAWVPVPALAGILILVAIRTIDWQILTMLTRRAAIFDFFVISGVIIVALRFSLMAAAGTGFALSTIFFLREQIMGTVIRRKNFGNAIFSKRSRLSHEQKVLQKEGIRTVIYEIQGNLFFGNTDRFYSTVIEDMAICQFVIINLRMVQSIDSTAVHMFDQIDSALSEKKGRLILTEVPHSLSGGQSVEKYFREVGLVKPSSHILIFDEFYDAVEWVEDFILSEKNLYHSHLEESIDISEMEIFRYLPREKIAAIKTCLKEMEYKEGEKIFLSGDSGDELFFIRKGLVKILLRITESKTHHLATFGRGDFFGDMSFVDPESRSADAFAVTNTRLYALSKKKFNVLAQKDPELGKVFYENLARVLAQRFRSTHFELRSLE
ncbi:MAG: SulP family inorganic anion transporter [Spirochaetia bacterium]|nr:SulP family inorganic anion transporter [Spirochaetia bacterium]